MSTALDPIPYHLRQFIAEQEYSRYTAIDHASWRYIMRIAREFFKHHAHNKYLSGLAETGITTEQIPKISEMDEKLQQFGWRVASITGFIPPAVFLEMLSLQILPIACDMRKLEHIEYTPAPDIVHEAAGHAPLIADEAYASYLRKFGDVARYVIFAKEDNDVYHAVLELSEIKEDPHSTPEDVERAQKALDEASARVSYVSEAQELTRLSWWTTEYGLFKDGDKFLLYGAGLLSSIGESYECLSDKIPKIPLTIDCIKTDYDITKPQPQLFYTDDFKKLEDVIDELASQMAYKQGGVEGLKKAKRAETVTTTVLDSNLQISGIVTEFRTTRNDQIYFIKYTGPVQLAYKNEQLEDQGPKAHPQGFSSPLGRIKGVNKRTADLRESDLVSLGFAKGQKSAIEFDSGIKLEGVLTGVTRKENTTLLLSFDSCSITSNQEELYRPEWGRFDLACGERVVSVFGEAADRTAYLKEIETPAQTPRPQKINLTKENEGLVPLYARVREIREANKTDAAVMGELEALAKTLDERFPNDWLLRLEILELLSSLKSGANLQQSLHGDLKRIGESSPKLKTLIERGVALL